MPTGAKIAVAGLLIVGTIAYLAWQGAADTWQYYVTVDECLAQSDALAGSRLRVSGPIEPGSLAIAPQRTEAAFALSGAEGTLRVTYRGTLPDNLREKIDVVAEGRLDAQGTLCADKLLTRCASKYAAQAEEQTASAPSTPAASARR